MPRLLVDPYLNFVGRRFNRLLVLREDMSQTRRAFLCRCDCGVEKVITANHLKNGRIQSCGCLHREVAAETCKRVRTIHGESLKTPEYTCWRKMLERCYNPNAANYRWYGGLGIRVDHEPWILGFQSYRDYIVNSLGRRPSPQHTIDRIDNNDHYKPGNLRWATKKEQAQNRRKANPLRRNIVKRIPRE